MKKTLTILTALFVTASVFAESLPINMKGFVGNGLVLSDTGHTISDTLTLQHAKSLKTIDISPSDLIKIKNSRGKSKGQIVSISDSSISMKIKCSISMKIKYNDCVESGKFYRIVVFHHLPHNRLYYIWYRDWGGSPH